MRQLMIITTAVALACAAGALQAQTFPSKPIRIIVAFPPGGGNDIIARFFSARLTGRLDQQMVIDNRGGASGIIGTEIVARAAPDGYTLLFASLTHSMNEAIHKLAYDTLHSFVPVALLGRGTNVLVANPSLPARSLPELIALAKAKPGALDYGSGGNGSAAHLATEYFKLKAGVDIQHIPYKGTAPALQDLVGGQIALMITGLPPVLPHVKAGRLRILGVASAQRLKLFPDIPTIAESGVPGFEATQWYGILAPAATPKDVVAKLNREIAKALADPAVAAKLAGEGADPAGDTPDQFAAFIASEIDLWGKVIRATGAKAE